MNWIDRVELVPLGWGLYELRIGSRVLGTYSDITEACSDRANPYRDFAARNGVSHV